MLSPACYRVPFSTLKTKLRLMQNITLFSKKTNANSNYQREMITFGVVGWLVGCFGFLRPFETVFQSISGRLPERGRKKCEKRDERKKCPNDPHPHLLQAQ